MRIQGLLKLSLLDYPGKISCTVFTGGCNLRCPFCHNASLVLPERMTGEPVSEAAVFTFLEKRKNVLDAVCVTGGEPFLQPDLEMFIERVRALGFLVKLDTNGTYPERLRKLVEKGCVDYVAMDIKNSPEKMAQTVGLPGFGTQGMEESIHLLLEGHVPYEFRTTVVRQFHTEVDLVAIATMIKGAERFVLQQFVDSGDLIGHGLTGYDRTEMEGFVKRLEPMLPSVLLRGV